MDEDDEDGFGDAEIIFSINFYKYISITIYSKNCTIP
jgi:hypothetical protein